MTVRIRYTWRCSMLEECLYRGMTISNQHTARSNDWISKEESAGLLNTNPSLPIRYCLRTGGEYTVHNHHVFVLIYDLAINTTNTLSGIVLELGVDPCCSTFNNFLEFILMKDSKNTKCCCLNTSPSVCWLLSVSQKNALRKGECARRNFVVSIIIRHYLLTTRTAKFVKWLHLQVTWPAAVAEINSQPSPLQPPESSKNGVSR